MHLKSNKLMAATNYMLDEVNEIYLNCRNVLIQNRVFQWDDQYPNKEYFKECIENECLFVLMNDSKIIGHVVLNEWEPEEWELVTWQASNPIIIHSLMVDPRFQGRGVGKDFVRRCEEFAIEKEYNSIRLDAFSGNENAIRLYHHLGYQKRGRVSFKTKPEGYQEYICFEKTL
ncbi:Ribosomal protein S18 acetylase RimI [Mesobacillus persicus]|uniref:Ribosomal protein S18 acetylase RimI n=1 Tax=Mesobacillus persicus TaxID=930146 RepID=A0A1H8B083_9BACI|nr:GNAT family N-acetyltransferase [Mesobacillus persicus]SEM76391.1 Ribosomal protein S18 acetylase RimI [Mesobacillus persicus]